MNTITRGRWLSAAAVLKKLADPQSTNYTYVRVGADTKQKERVAIASPNSI